MNKKPPIGEGATDLPAVPQAGLPEVPLPDHLIARATAAAKAARADRTREAYRRAWAGFVTWCEVHGRSALPAGTETVAAWLADLADRGAAPSSINLYLSAVVAAHAMAEKPLDRRHPLIRDVVRGLRRQTRHTVIEARPLFADELATILDTLGEDPKAVRDAALLALGWAAALRRSELVGLDWQQLGEGSGFVTMTERGVELTLHRSKGSTAAAEAIAIPATDMADAGETLARWATLADLAPGQPVFRSVNRHGHIMPERLTDRSIARIVKERCWDAARARGLSEAAAQALVERLSGHSLRSGYATSAAAADVAIDRIQRHTRHRSTSMVLRYVRTADRWSKSGLKGAWRAGPFRASTRAAAEVRGRAYR